jgi:hypothetical protein
MTGTVPAAPAAPSTLRALGRAAAILWSPAVLPLFLGPLNECSHCVRTYGMLLPLMPGIVGRMVVRDTAGFVLAALLTLALLAGLTLALRRLPQRTARWLSLGVAAAIAAEALLLARLLRA